MDRQLVESSQIAAIGYDHATRVLEIEFKSYNKARANSVYTYQNITPAMYVKFMAAESKGIFFKNNIKPFVIEYPYLKIA